MATTIGRVMTYRRGLLLARSCNKLKIYLQNHILGNVVKYNEELIPITSNYPSITCSCETTCRIKYLIFPLSPGQ